MIRFQSGRVAGSSGCSDLADTSRGPPRCPNRQSRFFAKALTGRCLPRSTRDFGAPHHLATPRFAGPFFPHRLRRSPQGGRNFMHNERTAANQTCLPAGVWLSVAMSRNVDRNAAATSRQRTVLHALHLGKFVGEPHASDREDQAISQSKRMNEPATAMIVVVLARQSRLTQSDGPSHGLHLGMLPRSCVAGPKQDHTARLRRFGRSHAPLLS